MCVKSWNKPQRQTEKGPGDPGQPQLIKRSEDPKPHFPMITTCLPQQKEEGGSRQAPRPKGKRPKGQEATGSQPSQRPAPAILVQAEDRTPEPQALENYPAPVKDTP